MAISQEQRKKLGLPQQDAAEHQREQTPSLERIEEGQEIAPEAAERLQPQMGNHAVQALLSRTSSTTQTASNTAELELAEEIGESKDEEHDGSSLEMPDVAYGGGGDGIPVEESPWEVGHLFGGDDDAPPPKPKPRRRPHRQNQQHQQSVHIDDPFAEEELEVEHAQHVEKTLGETPHMNDEYRAGDAQYRAIEIALHNPHVIGRNRLIPESLIDRTDHLDPVGRATSIGRFLSKSATNPMARALARTLSGPASILMAGSTGYAGATARLASLTVAAEAIEGGATETDNAVRLALCRDAWPTALTAARKTAKTGRVVAPKIVEAAGEISAENRLEKPNTHSSNHHLATVRLGHMALNEILPIMHVPHVPNIQHDSSPPMPTDNPALAAVDAVLAEFTGGFNPADVPAERTMDPHVIQPVLSAATELVNAMGKAQVELAAAAIALARIHDSPPTQSTLRHADNALRTLARTVVQAGDRLHQTQGAPAAAVGDLPNEVVTEMRKAAEAFASLRVWALHALAEGVLR